jgi:hypothetical protein
LYAPGASSASPAHRGAANDDPCGRQLGAARCRECGAVTGGEVHADIEGFTEQDIGARYIRLVLSSFLILIGRFVTLEP